MRKVCSVTHLQHLIHNYIGGYANVEGKRHKGGGATGSHDIFYDGERDATEVGRAKISFDLDTPEARIIMRLRSVQGTRDFMKLPHAMQNRTLAEEGQRACDELADDGDFQPYSASYRTMHGEGVDQSDQIRVARAAAEEAAGAAYAATQKAEASDAALQKLRKEAAQNRHDAEATRLENEAIKAENAAMKQKLQAGEAK